MAEQTNTVRYVQAINTAYREEMRRDERVVMWGEDIVAFGGGFRETSGIVDDFGEDRIKDTPIVESAIVEMAVGAALTGLRPVGFIMFAGFLACCFDGVFMKIGAGPRPMPVVISAMIGGGGGTGLEHCMSPEALFIHSPGLKVVMPSTAYDAKGLLKTAIRDDDPVLFMPHMQLYRRAEELPAEEYLIPFGQADVKREGDDITVVTYSAMVHRALAAAETLAEAGINVEVVDPRTLVPLDVATIAESVKKTGRLLIVHEAMGRGGVAGEIAFQVTEALPDVFDVLEVPIRRLVTKNVALPHGAGTEAQVVPQVEDIVQVVKEMVD